MLVGNHQNRCRRLEVDENHLMTSDWWREATEMLVDTAVAEKRVRENLDRPLEEDVKGWGMELMWKTIRRVDEVDVTRK